MASTWTHPELGRFKFDDPFWVKAITAPAFDAFTLYQKPRKKTRTYELRFLTYDEAELPSPGALTVVEKVLANQANLAPKVIKALWDDFTGRGPKSGMYWHGDLDEVAIGLEDADLPPPSRPEDLFPLMCLYAISVRQIGDPKKPLVELSFHAAFEEEHGVGILTNGQSILGIGYASDVRPFKAR